MLTSGSKGLIRVAIVVLLAVVALMQTRIDPMRHEYEPNSSHLGTASKDLPIEFALGAVVGFREAVAGLLWVKADSYFDSGDYAEITPLVRIITWLDPHQVDVYETGAWHMDYNFTDVDQRSDRRYIPLSIALMKEGIENNPDIPRMCSELGFTHFYRKICDFAAARDEFAIGQAKIEKLIALSEQFPNDAMLKETATDAAKSVTGSGHGLAHAYESLGDYQDAIKQWQYCVNMHEKNMTNGLSEAFGEQMGRDVCQQELNETVLRAKWRKLLPKDPVDVGFQAELVRVAPKVFVVRGRLNVIGAQPGFVLESNTPPTWGPVNGCRVEVRLEDEGYKTPTINSFALTSLNLSTATIMQDSVPVRFGLFDKKIDMSQDPSMYSFTAPRYTVTVWWNPNDNDDTPVNVRDRVGWLGEGLTDSHYLDASGILPGDSTHPVPGLRFVRETFLLTRDDLLGQGKKVFDTPVPGNTSPYNY